MPSAATTARPRHHQKQRAILKTAPTKKKKMSYQFNSFYTQYGNINRKNSDPLARDGRCVFGILLANLTTIESMKAGWTGWGIFNYIV